MWIVLCIFSAAIPIIAQCSDFERSKDLHIEVNVDPLKFAINEPVFITVAVSTSHAFDVMFQELSSRNFHLIIPDAGANAELSINSDDASASSEIGFEKLIAVTSDKPVKYRFRLRDFVNISKPGSYTLNWSCSLTANFGKQHDEDVVVCGNKPIEIEIGDEKPMIDSDFEKLSAQLKNPDERASAFETILALNDPRVRPLLTVAWRNFDALNIRVPIVRKILTFNDGIGASLTTLMEDTQGEAGKLFIIQRALKRADPEAIVKILKLGLSSRDAVLREASARVIGSSFPERHWQNALSRLTEDPNEIVRSAAKAALDAIAHAHNGDNP